MPFELTIKVKKAMLDLSKKKVKECDVRILWLVTLHGTRIYTNQNYGNLRDKFIGDVAHRQLIGKNFSVIHSDFRFYERIVDFVGLFLWGRF